VTQAALRVITGPAAGSEISLEVEELVIGRSEAGAGSLSQDPELSRRHARISRDEDRFVLEDLDSRNGTFLNGWRIPAPQVLTPGDRIEVGSSVLEAALPVAQARTVIRPTRAAPEGPVLRAVGVEKAYGDLQVLKGVDLEIQPGEICGLLGPNGAGKTSFVSIVAGLRSADAGSVQIVGIDALRDSPRARAHLGLAPQDLGVYATVTVRRNLELFGEIAGLRGPELKARVEQIAEALSLTPKLDAAAGTLSGGQQRRLHTAMALVHKPALCILDEPTVGADIRTRQEILDMVKGLAADGHAVCYSTHYLPEIEELGASVAILEGGTIIARGAIADLVAEHSAQGVELHFDGAAPDVDLAVDGAVVREGSVIRIETKEPTVAAATVLGRLGAAAMRLKEVEVIRASLDSVYLALTERRYSGVHPVPQDAELVALPPPPPESLVAAGPQSG
jgi:ABC-2 type transport system ATP-binding protein